MSERPPDIQDILDELDPAERDRLRSVHELLVQAGPPPELSPELAAPRPPKASVIPFPRYRSTILAAAVAAAVILFGIGYGIGRSGNDKPEFTVTMTGAGGAHAALAVFSVDDAGNWPMKLQVRGLRPLPKSKRYELWLTRSGELVQPCGTFAVTDGETEVPLNAPYRLRSFDGWVVVVEGSEKPVLRTAQV
jgi:Anti-sigma-K factor rskA